MEKVETTVHECQTDIEVRESGKKSQLTSLFGFIFGLLDNLATCSDVRDAFCLFTFLVTKFQKIITWLSNHSL